MTVGPFIIENQSEADEYLEALLERPEFRSMDEVSRCAQKYIKDARLADYFNDKARQILKT
jgi:hypothetical protein